MYYADSRSFFEISNGPQLDNDFQSRLLCLKDFIKRLAIFPFALLYKAAKTIFRAVGLCFGAALIIITVGSSVSAREFFVERAAIFARDLADWLLLPFALFGCFFRLILGLLIHPSFYFNGLA